MNRSLTWISALVVLGLIPCHFARAQAGKSLCPFWMPSPPSQPEDGPGSTDYRHGALRVTVVGEGVFRYYVFEPDGPVPPFAPVIGFIHGFGITDPRVYGNWIRHLVRRGNTVVFPVYQENMTAPIEGYDQNVLAALRDAWDLLALPDRVAPAPGDFALMGHSAGALIAAKVADQSADYGLPAPRALLLVNAAEYEAAGIRRFREGAFQKDFSGIPAETLVLAVVAENDRLVTTTPESILQMMSHVPPQNKEIVLLRSDDYGCPPLNARHISAGGIDLISPNSSIVSRIHRDRDLRSNALEYYGYWKWLDALTDAAFFGIRREYALGGGPEQTFMGVWSDGTPVLPARVIWP